MSERLSQRAWNTANRAAQEILEALDILPPTCTQIEIAIGQVTVYTINGDRRTFELPAASPRARGEA